MIFDAHTHIHFSDYDDDRDEVVRRAQKAEVKMITVGINVEDSKRAIEWAAKYPDDIWATVGVHPTEVGSGKLEIEKLERLARHPKTAAVGECGLDYYRSPENKKEQKEEFLEQAMLAEEVGKPLMIHCRPSKGADDAYNDLAAILTPSQGVKIIHFFVGSLGVAKELLRLNCYFTFGGAITFARDYDEVIKFLPLENILLETDAPFVAPVPYRGKRNEPAHVVEVAKKLAEIKGLDYNAVTEQTTKNVVRILKF